MPQTLYRKYRPKNFSEVIGQAPVVRTLTNAIKNNHIGHAYLFTGPRGTGKTSIARILAKTINCKKQKNALSCEKCSSCKIINSGKSLDIIEIDAASNTGVDNIRELRNTVSLVPTSLKYKVYIIDEVHMLSAGAFNALLKTLEEPPAHIIFILATTEISKVPDTIISRCQRFDFTRLPINGITQKLALIAKAEKVKIEKEALAMIAIAAEGGMRDAESSLGQIIALEDKHITAKEVEEILGTTDKKIVQNVSRMIIEKNCDDAIAEINKLMENGYDLKIFNKSLINYLRQLMLLKINNHLKKYFSFELTEEQIKKMNELAKKAGLSQIISTINLLLEAKNKISSTILPQLPLEIAIIKATHKFPSISEKVDHKIQNIKQPRFKKNVSIESNQNTKKEIEKTKKKFISPDTLNKNEINNNTPEKENDSPSATFDLDTVKQNWNKLLIDIRPYNHSLSVLLASCQLIKVNKDNIVLATSYDFYKERIEEVKNKLTIEKILSKILGSKIFISVQIDKDLVPQKIEENAQTPKNQPAEQKNNLLDSALKIMGGKIVEK